jgi:hypothetical protein
MIDAPVIATADAVLLRNVTVCVALAPLPLLLPLAMSVKTSCGWPGLNPCATTSKAANNKRFSTASMRAGAPAPGRAGRWSRVRRGNQPVFAYLRPLSTSAPLDLAIPPV